MKPSIFTDLKYPLTKLLVLIVAYCGIPAFYAKDSFGIRLVVEILFPMLAVVALATSSYTRDQQGYRRTLWGKLEIVGYVSALFGIGLIGLVVF